jgi:hypothetical protein
VELRNDEVETEEYKPGREAEQPVAHGWLAAPDWPF